MSVSIIFPDLGNHKIAHLYWFEPSNTMRAVLSVLSCSVHMVYTEMWGTLSCFYYNLLYKKYFLQ